MDTRVEMTDDLCSLIRLSRTDVAGVSQKGAGLAAGDMSETRWRQIETGQEDRAPADTVARMCYAVGVTPEQLRAIGQTRLAVLVQQRMTLLEPQRVTGDDLEEYLLATPLLTDGQRRVLLAVARALLGEEQTDREGTIAG
jgi:hypothetical protein